MKQWLCVSFFLLLSIPTFASDARFCPQVEDIHRAEYVDMANYVSGLKFPLNKNRYVVRIVRNLYTPEGHKWSVWTEPYSSENADTAKSQITKLLPTLMGPIPAPKEHYWGDEQCWYLLGNGTYVVARYWW